MGRGAALSSRPFPMACNSSPPYPWRQGEAAASSRAKETVPYLLCAGRKKKKYIMGPPARQIGTLCGKGRVPAALGACDSPSLVLPFPVRPGVRCALASKVVIGGWRKGAWTREERTPAATARQSERREIRWVARVPAVGRYFRTTPPGPNDVVEVRKVRAFPEEREGPSSRRRTGGVLPKYQSRGRTTLRPGAARRPMAARATAPFGVCAVDTFNVIHNSGSWSLEFPPAASS